VTNHLFQWTSTSSIVHCSWPVL